MTTIETTVDSDATPDAVWTTLVDFDAYADWNPFITEASGTAAEGDRLSIRTNRRRAVRRRSNRPSSPPTGASGWCGSAVSASAACSTVATSSVSTSATTGERD